MRILIISQYYSPDPFRLHEAAEGLVNDGHEVTVLTGTPNYVTKKSIKEYNITIKSNLYSSNSILSKIVTKLLFFL